MSVKIYRRILVLLFVFMVIFTGIYIKKEATAQKSVDTSGNMDSTLLIAGGMPIGIYLQTEGVMITGTEEIPNASGSYEEPAKNLVKAGDYIVAVNGKEVRTKEEVIEQLNNKSNIFAVLKIRRKKEYIDINTKIVEDKEGNRRLGIWIKDDTQGLGTITFLTSDSKFGALGHGILESKTEQIFQISKGTLYETSILNIVKGKKGTPGGVEGVIVYNRYNVIGSITKNNETGIYGNLDKIKRIFTDEQVYPAAAKSDIRTGKAYIRSAISGEMKEYEITIKKVNLNTRDVNKGIEIQVTDTELIELTGGIIQGMSGSPIIQDGKIIGAVTHVFIQDSTRGYGIFIENMLENVKE